MSVKRQLARRKKKEKSDWNGRTYLVGDLCFRSRIKQRASMSFFYYEQFEVIADPPAKLNVDIRVPLVYFTFIHLYYRQTKC